MPVCRLCHRDRQLCRSHIVPEYLYRELYNDEDHMMAISGLGRLGWRKQQIGLRERLLCEECEQHCNRNFEAPFLASWVRGLALGENWHPEATRDINVDYVPFKLFHLCNLYRAAVSSLNVCAKVNLGPHLERIRQLLLDNDAGEDWQYLPLAFAVLHGRTWDPVNLVSFTQVVRAFGQPAYGMIYGGCQWWINIASNRNADWLNLSLRPTGVLPVHGVSWEHVGAIRQASAALRNAARNA